MPSLLLLPTFFFHSSSSSSRRPLFTVLLFVVFLLHISSIISSSPWAFFLSSLFHRPLTKPKPTKSLLLISLNSHHCKIIETISQTLTIEKLQGMSMVDVQLIINWDEHWICEQEVYWYDGKRSK
ncbi:hypothetical protein ACOSP7_007691 [Xanthoceras sorbifolium]